MRDRMLTRLFSLMLISLPLAAHAQTGPGAMGSGGTGMMHNMMDGGMWLMMLVPLTILLLVVTLLVLGIMALIKYLRGQ